MVGETPRTKPDPLAILLLTALVGALVFAATWKGRGVGSQASIEADAPVTAAVSAPAAEVDATSPEVAPAAAAEPQLKPPVFDLVRVEPDGSGSALLDDGVEVVVPAGAAVASGLRHLRVGQRVSVELDETGGVATRVWVVGIGPGETIH